MIKKLIVFSLLLFLVQIAVAQQSVSGTIIRAKDKKPLHRAVITGNNGTEEVTTKTDTSGKYEISIGEGEKTVVLTAKGYKSQTLNIENGKADAIIELTFDGAINDAVMPTAKAWENLVFKPIVLDINGDDPPFKIPIVVILLVVGATFFTIYFKFPAISKFSLAINTVRGKYDEIEGHEAAKTDLAIEGRYSGYDTR